MACVLTQGFLIDCRQSMGGVAEMYIATLDTINTITEASGVITAITKTSPLVFYKYVPRRNTSNATAPITGSTENGTVFYTHTVVLQLDKLATDKRIQVQLLTQNRLVIIVKDMNGAYWMFGKTRGVELNTGTPQTGQASGDLNGFGALTFTGDEPELPYEVASGIIAGLLTT